MAKLTEIGKKALKIIKDNAGIDLATLLTILATGAVAGAELISDLKKEKLLDDEDGLKVSKEGEEEIKEVKSEFFVKYKYFGIRDKETNRPFCARLLELNRVYTREDINTLSERLGYNVWMRRGGWYHNPDTGVNTPYCRHTWRQVIVKRKTQEFAGFNPNQKRNKDGKWGDGNSEKNADELTERDEEIIDHYTDEGFVNMNRSLQSQGYFGEPAEKLAKDVDDLNNALEKLPKFEGTVFRGIDFGGAGPKTWAFEGNIKSSKNEVLFKGFTSTSKNTSFPNDILEGGRGGGKYIIEILSKSGRDIGDYAHLGGEAEVIFKSGTKFKVLDYDFEGVIKKVKLEEL
jgi:hypothetical protein